MSTFGIGQRVRTTVDAPSAWPGGWGAPAGTPGTITSLPGQYGGYGVKLDGDPSGLAADYDADELVPADLPGEAL